MMSTSQSKEKECMICKQWSNYIPMKKESCNKETPKVESVPIPSRTFSVPETWEEC